jgi:hypothetical protein
MSPYGTQLDKSIGVIDFTLLTHDKLVVALQNASYMILNDSGSILSKGKVNKLEPGGRTSFRIHWNGSFTS